MIVSINQPAYIPWLGYFHRIHLSDVHVVLDHVQFEKNSFTNRNKIRTKEGNTMLTVPLKTSGLFGNLAINSIELADDIWRIKHLKSIQSAYAKAVYFKTYEPAITAILSKPYHKLIELLLPFNDWILQELKIQTKLVKSSDMDISAAKSDLVLEICRSLKATTYLSGPFGRDYLDMESFKQAGIQVVFHDYVHPVYKQTYPDFEPYMSVLDLLFNNGPESLTILNQKNEATVSK